MIDWLRGKIKHVIWASVERARRAARKNKDPYDVSPREHIVKRIQKPHNRCDKSQCFS